MAERKKLETEPDVSAAVPYPQLRVKQMTPEQFKSIIRNIKKLPLGSVEPLLTHTFYALRRLKVARDLDEAVSGVPEGSDHFDLGTFKSWCDNIGPEDKAAVAQLVMIDATAKTRMTS